MLNSVPAPVRSGAVFWWAGEVVMTGFEVVEASVAELVAALDEGRVTSVSLVAQYLNRIARYDRRGPRLNSTPVLNPAEIGRAHV